MINEKHQVTTFNDSNTPLKNTCINAAAEDEQGNIYFSHFDFRHSTERNRTTEGIAKYSNTSNWLHYNDENSGMPGNQSNSLFYDRFRKVLWIGTNEAGLVRFDLNNDWQVFTLKIQKYPVLIFIKFPRTRKANCTFLPIMV